MLPHARHTLPGVVLVAVIVGVFFFFLPPLTRMKESPKKLPKQPIVQTKIVPKPITKAPVPKTTAPVVAPKVTQPAPAPVVTVQPKATPPPAVKPSPSSSVSNLQTSSSSSGGSTGGTTTSSPPSTTSSPQPTTTPPPQPDYTSTNWSGYFASGDKYTSVSSSWTVPTPTGNNTSLSADASWIGVGGITTSDLIQVGTDDTVSSGGQVTAGAFYELLPASSTSINSLSINPGDSISALVSQTSSGVWAITITDNTDKQTFSTNVDYSSTLSSAEWIEEDPSNSSGDLYPLDNFGNVAFSSASTVANGSTLNLSGAGAFSIGMVNSSGQLIADPSAIGSDGASFSVVQESQ